MDNFIKVGYFRARNVAVGSVRYIPYAEYNSWSADAKRVLKEQVDAGREKLFCACCRNDELALSITANLVVRVASNGNQEKHMDSCPKSVYYASWNEQSRNGVTAYEDSQILFNISLPQVGKSASSSSSSSSSSGTGTGTPREKKTGILEMVTILNRLAWEKQTFSKKKEIRESNKAGLPQSWNYKSLEEFNRLIFGISNDVYCACQGSTIPFINLCYRKDAYYSCTDWRRQWFFYAVVERISEVKPARKYQYVTLRMPSDKSAAKAVIRVGTEDFNGLFDGYMEDMPGTHRVLTGYMSRRIFKGEDGSVNEWMQLIKGVVIMVSENGLIVENEKVAAVANMLCANHVLFKSPYLPLENYGGEIPSFEIERLNAKNLIIDYPQEALYETRSSYGEENEEYDCLCLKDGDDYESMIFELLTEKERRI